MKFTIPASRIPAVIEVCAAAKRTPMFVGRPGISKTAQVHVAARAMTRKTGIHHEVYILHLATLDTPDARGFVVPVGDECRFTKPPFWHVIEKHSHGILCLDEYAQCSHDMQKATSSIILDRMLGEHKLPDGWSVVLTGNRLEDNAGANSMLTHIINRMAYIEVEAPTPDEWVMWGVNEGLPSEVLAFAKLRPDVVFNADIPSEADTPYCTPRSLAAAGELATHFPGGMRSMVDSPEGMALLAGTIGVGATGELAGVVRVAMNLPSYETIIANPETAPVPAASEPSMLYAACMLVATRVTAPEVDAAMTYVSRMPFNFQLAAVMAIACRDVNFVAQSAKMRDWVRDHSTEFRPFGQYINTALSNAKK